MESMAVDLESESEVDFDVEEKLEWDVRQMTKKISEYRQTLPDHLRNTLDSALSSHRSESDPLPSNHLTIAAETQVHVLLVGTEEQDSGHKMIQLKERMSRNAANIPNLVKRVRECTEGIDKLHSLDVTIHPAFTRQRIN